MNNAITPYFLHSTVSGTLTFFLWYHDTFCTTSLFQASESGSRNGERVVGDPAHCALFFFQEDNVFLEPLLREST